MSASRFFAVGVAYRVVWAAATLSLAFVLPVAEYATFAFVQITAVTVSQLVLGVFSNVLSAGIARTEQHVEQGALVVAGTLYGLGLCVVTGLVVGFTGIGGIGIGGALAATAWMFGGLVGPLVGGLFLARGQYSRAIGLLIAQATSYIGLLLLVGRSSGDLAALSGGLAQMIPGLLALASQPGAWARSWNSSRKILRSHVSAVTMNLSYAPMLLLAWLLSSMLAQQANSQAMASYGLANQVTNLCLFLPASIAPIVIVRLSRENEEKANLRLVGLVLLGFGGVGLCATLVANLLLGELGPWLPEILAHASTELTLGLLLASLMAARSGFAWLNQVEGRSDLEIPPALISAAALSIGFLVPWEGASFLLGLRTAGALGALAISAAILLARSRQLLPTRSGEMK
jgi:hypothetical protein